MFSNDRSALRKQYLDAWNKFLHKKVLTPLERQIVTIIQEHPEYQYLFDEPEKFLNKDFDPQLEETNPFLHMSMHAVIKDQIQLNTPKGIHEIYERLMLKYANPVEVEHRIMEAFIPLLWDSMRYQKPFDALLYLDELKKMI